MTFSTAVRSAFTLERSFPASPARVFAAFADPVLKARWSGGGDGWTSIERSADFRGGDREVAVGLWASGTVSAFEAHYHDIVPERRIVYSYAMRLDGLRISVSLATIDILPAGRPLSLEGGGAAV